jgi:hypothetical protein
MKFSEQNQEELFNSKISIELEALPAKVDNSPHF